MSLIYRTSKWLQNLWSGHCKVSRSAQQLLSAGKAKQAQFPAFGQSLHDALYSRHVPLRITKPTPPAWADDLLHDAMLLPEWRQLHARCQANGFATGWSTEILLQALLPLLPEPPQKQPQGQGIGSPQPGSSQPGQNGNQQHDGNGDARRALRQGLREALHAADAATETLEGITEALGFEYGTGQGNAETLQGLENVRRLYALIKDNDLLKKICSLAGRLQRLASSYKRTRVTPGVGPIKGITLGGDLPLILPSELIGLRSTNKVLRIATLGKVMAKRALQYEIEGLVPAARGPVILCLDKSGSMQGEAEIWAKAVAMTLLKTAMDQQRAFHYIGFYGRKSDAPYSVAIQRQQTFLPGETAWQDVIDVLLDGCDGGTDFEAPLHYALAALHTSAVMKHADIVMISDGAGRINLQITEEVNKARQEERLHVYCIAIGKNARLHTLQPISDEMYQLSNHPEKESEKVTPILALID